jgi:hypothetical protein
LEPPGLILAVPLAPESDGCSGFRISVIGEIDVEGLRCTRNEDPAAYEWRARLDCEHRLPVDALVLVIMIDVPLNAVVHSLQWSAVLDVATQPEVAAIAYILERPAVADRFEEPL